MQFQVYQDIESVLELLEISQDEFAKELGVSRVSVNNWLSGKSRISNVNTRKFYEFAYDRGIRLNKIKEQFYIEDDIQYDEVLLFHGAKTKIEGPISLGHNKKINDFGDGFYCGESLEQSAMFVASYPDSSLYMVKFSGAGLNGCYFDVSRDWMLLVAYYRGKLKGYESNSVIKKLLEKIKNIDFIVAPIADNRMYEIIDSFIDGEITDIQCQHCLSATNLGKQYVLVSQRSLGHLTILERCFLTNTEKEHYLTSRRESFHISQDKVKLARKQYRNQGEYIEDILI